MSSEEARDTMSDEMDDSSSDSDTEDNDAKEKIDSITKSLADNPYEYSHYEDLIKLYKSICDFDSLRSIREKFRDHFPLNESIWMAWIEDEKNLADSGSETEKEFVDGLYEAAFDDYLSVPLWSEYILYSLRLLGSKEGTETIRKRYQKAIDAAGIHVASGTMIWQEAREVEMALLSAIQAPPGAVLTADQVKDYNAQRARVDQLFRRQLSIPMLGLEDAYKEYSDWLDCEMDASVSQGHDKALSTLQSLKPYEDALASADTASVDHLEAYRSYIDFETKLNEPTRMQSLFERALADFPLQTDLWLQYTDYLEMTLKVKGLSEKVFQRGVKNCPWCAELWCCYLRALERAERPFERIREIFNRSLQGGAVNGSEHLALWKTWLDYLRRRLTSAVDEKTRSEYADELRDAFQKAYDYHEKYFGLLEADPECSLLMFWASVEARQLENLSRFRELWTEIMTKGFGNQSKKWMQYIQLELALGDNKHARKLFQRAVNSVTDNLQEICDAYVDFEREQGTLETLDIAITKTQQQIKRVGLRLIQQAEKEQVHEKQLHRKKPRGFEQNDRKKSNNYSEKKSQAKQQVTSPKKQTVKATKVDDDGFKIPQPPLVVTRTKRLAEATTDEQSQFDNKKPKLEDSSPTKELSTNMNISSSKSQECTVFVSNLDYQVSESELTQEFGRIGAIANVRLVKGYKGKSKGFAYVDFAEQKSAHEALKHDRKLLNGRPMFISKCEDKATKTAAFKFSSNLERNKLFVKGLPFTCSKEALQQIFAEYGELTEVRMVTYRSGAPKGLAYVEFKSEENAKTAMLKTDGLVMGEHTVSVALSNPPPRRQTPEVQEKFVPSLGSAKREIEGGRRGRTQVNLRPRIVEKTKEHTVNNGSESVPSNRKQMSNSDFRDMLLK